MSAISAQGYTWEESPMDMSLYRAHVHAGVAPLSARLLSGWGVTLQEYDGFIRPRARGLLPASGIFMDMDVAVQRLYTAISCGERVGVWGDYDVDGACATALMVRALRLCGLDPVFHIPDRQIEGYGPNIPGLERMAKDGITLCVIVDSGTTAFDALDAAALVGLDVIVIDHHLAHDVLPKAVAVVNPNRRDQPAESPGYLCAAGVVFCVLQALWTYMRHQGKDPPVVPSQEWMAIAGLATVADVVPMRGFNRALALDARRVLASGRAVPGMMALMQVANLDPVIQDTGFLFGFGMGPRINAGGRIGDASMGARLLVEDDPARALELAQALDSINVERRRIEADVRSVALERLQDVSDPVLIVADPAWHEGIVGIVAGRLKELRRAPALVFGGGHDGVLKGSGRSVPGFDIGSLAMEAVRLGIIERGGGHAMAGGFTILPDQLDGLRTFLVDAFRRSGLPEHAPLSWDLDVAVEEVNVAMVSAILSMQPFGPKAEEPMVRIRGIYAVRHRLMGSTPGKRVFKVDCAARPRGPALFSAVIFSADDHPLVRQDSWLSYRHDMLARLSLNTWNGQTTVQCTIQDVMNTDDGGIADAA